VPDDHTFEATILKPAMSQNTDKGTSHTFDGVSQNLTLRNSSTIAIGIFIFSYFSSNV
jgi:hypothetical protein